MPYYTLIKTDGSLKDFGKVKFDTLDVEQILQLEKHECWESKPNIGINILGKEFVVNCIWNDYTRPTAKYNYLINLLLNQSSHKYNISYKRSWRCFDVFEDVLIESQVPIYEDLCRFKKI